jgi:hypothetical protein
MTLLQLFRSAVLRFYYSITEKQQLISEKLVSYMHYNVKRNYLSLNTFKYKNEYFYVSVSETL